MAGPSLGGLHGLVGVPDLAEGNLAGGHLEAGGAHGRRDGGRLGVDEWVGVGVGPRVVHALDEVELCGDEQGAAGLEHPVELAEVLVERLEEVDAVDCEHLVCAAVGHGQGASVALVELDLLLAKEGVSAQLLDVRLVPLDRMQLAGRAAAQDRVDATPVARANLDDRLAVGGGEELDRRVDGRVVDPWRASARVRAEQAAPGPSPPPPPPCCPSRPAAARGAHGGMGGGARGRERVSRCTRRREAEARGRPTRVQSERERCGKALRLRSSLRASHPKVPGPGASRLGRKEERRPRQSR
mmetsp:Transcript_4398/g.15134  ORF Transcript_4398/g.15134 Transcript_4398/m.15134 type:complete len:299 (+) Transcript_4398:355-1251(+)